MKSNSDSRPSIIQPLGDGSYYYNFNIVEVTEVIEGESRTSFNCDTVHIWGKPTYEKCVKAILRERRDETEEFSLINKYNAFVVGISTSEEDRDKYLAYLQEIAEVKAMVLADIGE